MISEKTYHQYLLDYDQRMAQELWPYGIHHCGNQHGR